ncbi:hypothetical protein SARC_12473 [Sphaeroforma arctica JP610]|uniref:NUP210 Ig-like domain-containing protein n=1 Tax=Sphaeroforma arctica JP610 TaxID=667725 RepID=A0A0L0FDZ7_9EUKA|nr:hypothetical protein SARC_12473 [Sphaeroforma arctica JP610]KNC74992.1 hypothetical protein SARC_12473 [Sphaeroforma arctica JP610]|eukprot:XP_014148894.1 hypothetical protein SARC_12473 [Sphaeroforma arctica JP610]
MRTLVSIVLVVLGLFTPSTQAAKTGIRLNTLQVLLPWTSETSHRCTFLLHAVGGCYEWHNDNPNSISITPVTVPDGCSGHAWVTTVESELRSSMSTVTVTDMNSGLYNTVKVRVEEIAEIEVATTYRRLNWHEQEIVAINAYDRNGNSMNNVTGVQIEWVISQSEVPPLSFIPFAESNSVDIEQVSRIQHYLFCAVPVRNG